MYRFFVDENQITGDSIVIKGSDVNHIRNVLRMKIGEKILLSDGNDREYVCRISLLEEEQVVAAIEDMTGASRELPVKVTLFQALPKGDKMETIIQKMVELGAYEIVPVETKRCIVKLDAKKAANKIKRWNAIAESAAKQSKRGIMPNVAEVTTFAEALKIAQNMDMVLIPYENAEGISYTRQVLGEIKAGMNVGIFIGPEGGFAQEEVEAATNIGAKEITLGKRILRTETAGMAVMSVIMINSEE